MTETFIVGGWTEPRGSRPFFRALLLGVADGDGALRYVGQAASGFSDAELGRIWKRLHALRTRKSPFSVAPRSTATAHWVKPQLAIEITHEGWTAARTLRHPVYVGVRDAAKRTTPRSRSVKSAGASQTTAAPVSGPLLQQIDAIADSGGDGTLDLGEGQRLPVSNLGKVFWPDLRLTKGDVFRHYARVADAILPVLADRPLVMKRYPNGVAAKPFYQHRAPDAVPSGVRVETVATDTESRPHIIGGSLLTLLYTAQLASISQDPWFSRVDTQRQIDHVALDLDPPDDMEFARVLDVARWVQDELVALGASGFPKTSGSGGLHIYVPVATGTPYDAGLLFAQIVATHVAQKHPKLATIERSVAARRGRLYVDYLQNIQGKTLASAYSPRANEFAGVSTPLTWEEVAAGVSPRDFTIPTFAARLREAGDLWAKMRTAGGLDLRRLDLPR